MPLYQRIGAIGSKYLGKARIFKFGFNAFPMYRRSTARITYVSEDLRTIRIKLPMSYKNRNYVGSIFGGSMFSAVDPIPMVQLMFILNNDYVIWDQSAEIVFKAPARETLFAEFTYSESELADLEQRVAEAGETRIVKITRLTNANLSKTFCEVRKTIYVASKAHYAAKKQLRQGGQ